MQLQLIIERNPSYPGGLRYAYQKTKSAAEASWSHALASTGSTETLSMTLEWYSVEIPVRNAQALCNALNGLSADIAAGHQAMAKAEGVELLKYLHVSSDPELDAEPKPEPKRKGGRPRKDKDKPAAETDGLANVSRLPMK